APNGEMTGPILQNETTRVCDEPVISLAAGVDADVLHFEVVEAVFQVSCQEFAISRHVVVAGDVDARFGAHGEEGKTPRLQDPPDLDKPVEMVLIRQVREDRVAIHDVEMVRRIGHGWIKIDTYCLVPAKICPEPLDVYVVNISAMNVPLSAFEE